MFVGLTFQKGLYGKRSSMRQSIRSTLSVASSSAVQRRAVSIVLLNREELQILVEPKGKVAEVFSQVCDHLGLRETEYFGLAQLIDGEYHFTDLDLKVSKLAPKVRHGLKHTESQSVIKLYFRVQFYVDHVMLLRERVTRHQYYLQLRDNLLTAAQVCGEERCFTLAAFALQADLGSYNAHKHARAYFDPREYFPAWVISKHGSDYIVSSMPAMHSDLSGMTKMEAQMHYIKDVSAPPAAHNLHFYRLKKRKTDRLGTAWIGICPKGVEIYEELEDGFKNLLSTFLWPNIGKLIFEKKKFEIRAVGTPTGRKFTYYTGTDERAKYLLSLCRSTHQFQMDVQPKLAEIRHLEAEDKRRFYDNHREVYIYDKQELNRGRGSGRSHASSYSSSALPQSVEMGATGSNRTPPTCGVLDQRVSVISNTSSNTTSGIVSDRGGMFMSFDDSEDDMRGMEIMIDSPPSKTPSNYGSYTTHHARLSQLHNIQVFKVPTDLSSSPGSLSRIGGGDLPRPMSSSSRTTHSSNISRTSSCHSQRSLGKMSVMSSNISTSESVASRPLPPVPIPADVHIHRMSLAPTIHTVSSTPVPPGVAAVYSGVVTSAAPTLPAAAVPTADYSIVGSVVGASSTNNPTYVNVSEMMATGQLNMTPSTPVPANYVSDVSMVGQTFVAESHPIHQVVAPHNSSVYGPTGGAPPPVPEYQPAVRGSSVMPPDYPIKVLSMTAPNPPPVTPMVVTSHPHIPLGVTPQQCLPVDNSHPPPQPSIQPPVSSSGLMPNQPQVHVVPTQPPVSVGLLPKQHLAQTAPPLTPHLAHTQLAPPCTDQSLMPQTPPTAHITPPTLHKQPPKQQLQTIQAIVHAPPPAPVNTDTPLPPPAVIPEPLMIPTVPPPVLDHSVTVDDHTTGPSTPLTVLPPPINLPNSADNPAIATLQITPPPPPDYQTAAASVAAAASGSNTPDSTKPKTPAAAAAAAASGDNISGGTRPRGGLVVMSEWAYDEVSPRAAGRSQQRHHSMGKYDQLLSPNANRDSEKRPRSRRSKTCPTHGLMPYNVAAELQGLTGKNLSLPLLSALCSDSSLIQQLQEKCSCEANATSTSTNPALGALSSQIPTVSTTTTTREDQKSLSFTPTSPSATLITTDNKAQLPRPMSWHSDTVSVDQSFKLLNDEQGENTGASPIIPGSRLSYTPRGSPLMVNVAGQRRSTSDELAALTSSQLQSTPLIAGLLAPSLDHHRTTKLGGISGSTNSINNNRPMSATAMFPSKLTSGGHSPNSSETLHQQASMGLA